MRGFKTEKIARFPNLCKKSCKIVERKDMSMKKPKIFPLTSISTGLLSQVCVFSSELSEKDGYGNLKLGQTLVSTVFFFQIMEA